jgi:hypothetical protein
MRFCWGSGPVSGSNLQTANSVARTVIPSEAKQSIVSAANRRVDCFVAPLLAMTSVAKIRLRDPAARCARGEHKAFAQKRGRGECRVPVAPAASCAKCSNAHECSHHEFTGTPGIPARNGFNGLFRALPGDEFVLSPSSAH